MIRKLNLVALLTILTAGGASAQLPTNTTPAKTNTGHHKTNHVPAKVLAPKALPTNTAPAKKLEMTVEPEVITRSPTNTEPAKTNDSPSPTFGPDEDGPLSPEELFQLAFTWWEGAGFAPDQQELLDRFNAWGINSDVNQETVKRLRDGYPGIPGFADEVGNLLWLRDHPQGSKPKPPARKKPLVKNTKKWDVNDVFIPEMKP